MLKLAGWVALGVLIALGAGWLWGASRSWPLQDRVDRLETQLYLTDARARALAGRVDLYSLNFGAAARNFSGAAESLGRVLPESARQGGGGARAEQLRAALAALEEARDAANRLEQTAHGPADRAIRAISEAAQAPVR